MSDTPPSEDPSQALRLRRELRRQLHQVDDLTAPPARDFAALAIAAARAAEVEAEVAVSVDASALDAAPDDGPPVAQPATSSTTGPRPTPTLVEPLSRRWWPRLLVGLAAAAVIGAVAVPAIPQLLGGSSSSTSAGSLADTTAGGLAPQAVTGGAENRGGLESAPTSVPKAAPFASGVATGPSGSGSDLTPVVERLRARLTASPYDATSVVLLSDPTRVEVTLAAPDPAALDLARSLLPDGTLVTLLPAG